MPAFRSADEAAIREAAIARLRMLRPGARIIHEINVCGTGSNRIDVLAVDRAEIIAIEIKSKRDKIDRLKDQLTAMRGCAHHAIAVLHEKFLIEQETNKWRAEYQRDGVNYLRALPDVATWDSTWVYPEGPNFYDRWREPKLTVQQPLPSGALDMLWRDELLEMCGRYSVSSGKRPTMAMMKAALRWQLSGRDLVYGICAALRARPCIEADPAIDWKEAA